MNSRAIHSVLFFSIVLCSCLLHGQEFQLAIQSGHSEPIKLLQFSHNSELLASAGEDKKCIIWELKTRKQLQSFNLKSVPKSMFFLRGDSIIVTVEENKITTWDIAEGKEVHRHETHNSIQTCFEDSKGQIIYTDFILNYIGLEKKKLKEVFRYQLPSVLMPSPTGDSVLFHDAKSYGFIQQTPDKAIPIKTQKNNAFCNAPAKNVFLNQNYPFLYVLEREGKLGNNITAFRVVGKGNEKKLKKGFYLDKKSFFENIHLVAASTNYLITAYYSGQLKINSAVNGTTIESINHHDSKVNGISISPDEKYFASCSNEEIILWDLQSLKPIHCFRNATGSITTFNLSKDKNKLLIIRNKTQLQCWNLENNEINVSRLVLPSKRKNIFIKDLSVINDSIAEVYFLYGKEKTDVFGRSLEEIADVTEYLVKWNYKSNKLELSTKLKYNYHTKIKISKEQDLYITSQNGKQIIRSSKKSCGFNKVSIEHDTTLIFENKNAHDNGINCIRVDEENKLIYTSSEDGTLKMWNLQSGKEICMLLNNGKDFLYVSPQNYYYSSKGSIQNVGYRNGLSVYSFDQFDVFYNRPEMVLKALPFVNEHELNLFSLAHKKRLKSLGIKEDGLSKDLQKAPILKIQSNKYKSTRQKNYMLKHIAFDSIYGISSVTILINGTNLFCKKYSGNFFLSDSSSIELNQGKNYIQVYATNTLGINSLREGFLIDQTENEKPNLFVLSIGSGKFQQKEYDLKYAAKDAIDFGDSWKKNRKYNTITRRVLINEEVKNQNIYSEIKKLCNTKINDYVIVFFAGHGVLNKDLNYFLSTHDIDFNLPEHNGLSYDSLILALNNIPARYKILFVDACHSGEIDKEELVKTDEVPLDDGKLVFRAVNGGVAPKSGTIGAKKSLEYSKIIFSDLRSNNGVSVVSSAGGAEFAIEGDQWNNGIFTYCLINGIKKNRSDINHDGRIFLSELQDYLRVEVNRLTRGLQVPTSRNENIYNDILIK